MLLAPAKRWNSREASAFHRRNQEATMKTLTMLAVTALLTAAPAFGQDTTVIHRETPVGSSTTVRQNDVVTGSTVEKRTTTSDTAGCSTKSVTRSNDDGDTVTKTKTDC
jgi:hypothetical protein